MSGGEHRPRRGFNQLENEKNYHIRPKYCDTGALKTAASLEITTLAAATPLNMQLAELADAMNEAKSINVHTILPARGKIIFTTEKGASNSDVICTVCDAITRVFNIVPIVSNERAKEIV